MGINKDDQLKKIAAGNFVENNGRVLRTINILRHSYNKLSGIRYALEDIAEDEILDSINFLFEEGYIHLRNISSKQDCGITEIDYKELEAKLTGKGIRLLAGRLNDDCIKV